MKRNLLIILCLVTILINFSYIHTQEENQSTQSDSEAEANKKWKQMREEYTKKMDQLEKTPPTLTDEMLQQHRQNTQYKNRVINQLQQKSEQSTVTSNRFSSFLSMTNSRSIPEGDAPSKFFTESGYVTWIHGIPSVGQTNVSPWAGSYWPMRNGGVSIRYGKNEKNTIGQYDPESGYFISLYNWAMSVSMYAQPSENMQVSTWSNYADYVNTYYSAAEKYDLLVGDLDFTLTNFSKNEGAQYAWGGDVVGWFGICHGWAAASYYYPKPTVPVYLRATNGMTIKFNPDDIKALTSLFFANAQYKTLFIGFRCEYYYPDPGWFTSPSCLSLNPAAFLLIVGNQVGLRGKNLTFDPEADPEIWNHPLKSYEFRFYNPLTNEFFSNAAGAKVSMDYLRGSSDSFLQYVANGANPKAVSAVGVFMKIHYTIETDITALRTDGTTAEDTYNDAEFDSIIELDEGDNVVGGEWKYKSHPNFIWHYDESEPIHGVSDDKLPAWYSGPEALELIKQASARGQPIKAIVNLLTNSY